MDDVTRSEAMLFDDIGPGDSPGFDDGKDAAALRTIGEVAKALGVKPHVLRYWEEQFPALAPIKRSGNRRYYRPEDVALIGRIDRLVHKEGYTLRGAAKALADKSLPSNASIAAGPMPRATESNADVLLKSLAKIRGELAAALAAA